MFARSAFRAAQPLKLQARRYATEPAKGGSSNTALYAGAAAALAGGAYYFLSGSSSAPAAAQKAEAKVKEAGFVSLKLEDVEIVNHNTKKFRFKLPEDDMVSGLEVASAVLTKYKGPEDEKATLRPYTPTSDEGEFAPSLSRRLFLS
ncbi:NADH-cytochrome b5 reductase 2 [Colletotrichum liriopes]|uniref:cytochrome-b5 reductase n=1 Tax=Colletotrichum liriopes TaxID=708192 RepID=A0AA37GW43_9PEZI|nr:NADH-cytochrome b5 reductase 2 [Colletotrichum liriopes]